MGLGGGGGRGREMELCGSLSYVKLEPQWMRKELPHENSLQLFHTFPFMPDQKEHF